MRRKSDILVIVPAFNEEANIGRVAGMLREKTPDLDYIIVNDNADKAAQELAAIILAEHGRAADHMDLLKQV